MLMPWAVTSVGQTQPDSVVAVVAAAQGLPLVSAQDQPPVGTYWEVRNCLPCVTAALPCPPFDPNTPVYALGGDHFLADETAGPLVSPLARPYANRALSTADYAAILQAQVDELQNFIVQDQALQLSAQSTRNGTMSALDLDSPPLPPWATAAPMIRRAASRTTEGLPAPTTCRCKPRLCARYQHSLGKSTGTGATAG